MHVPAPLGRCHVVLVGVVMSGYCQSQSKCEEIYKFRQVR